MIKQGEIFEQQKNIVSQQTGILQRQELILELQTTSQNEFQSQQLILIKEQNEELKRQNMLAIDPNIDIHFDIEGYSHKYRLMMNVQEPIPVNDLHVYTENVEYNLLDKEAFSFGTTQAKYEKTLNVNRELSLDINYDRISRFWQLRNERIHDSSIDIYIIPVLLFKISYRHPTNNKEFRIKKYLIVDEMIVNKDTTAMAYDPDTYETMDINSQKIELFNTIKEIEDKRIWLKASHFDKEFFFKR